MRGICKLYQCECDLRESHIYPKFVIDHFKKTGSRFIRPFDMPNKRMQDGLKKYYLSERAEQEFGKREKWFAENIFRPYLSGEKKQFQYDENLYYFSLSFLWRVLINQLELPSIKALPYYQLLEEVELEWRNFLSAYQYPENPPKINLLFTDRVKSHDLGVPGVDYYFTRTLDSTIVSNDRNDFIVVYGKFLRFVFWVTIKTKSDVNNEFLLVNPIGGTFHIPQQLKDDGMGSFFMNRIKEIEALPKPSESQQNLIVKEILKNPEQFATSDAGQAIYNDHEHLNPSTHES